MWYSCDFETDVTLKEGRTYVWAWGIMPVQKKDSFSYGTDIESFIAKVINNTLERNHIYDYEEDEFGEVSKVDTYFFHNLRFDGNFILNYLYSLGLSDTTENGARQPDKSIYSVIGDMGQYYLIRVKMGGVVIKFQDSLKKIPDKIANIAKSLGLERLKGEIDYSLYRKEGGELDKKDYDYLYNDVWILKECLRRMFQDKHLTGMTIGSDCLKYYKSTLGKNKDAFRMKFPLLTEEEDKYIRRAYRGGYVYVNPKYKNKIIKKKGWTVDFNSMYPSVMHSKMSYLFPYGEPKHGEGMYDTKDNFGYPLFIQHLKCYFRLKKDRWPTISMKGNPMFKQNEYITDSMDIVDLWLTNTDLDWFFENYDIYEITFIDYYSFKGARGLFDKYIDHWFKIKKESNNDPVMRALSKLFLNNLYGKFISAIDTKMKVPYLKDGVIRYNTLDTKREGVYPPVGAFCTAYARDQLFSAIDRVGYDKFVYCDTDSIHFINENDKIPDLVLDDTELGAWKLEGKWQGIKAIRAKTYAEEIYWNNKKGNIDPTWSYTCAGMTPGIKKEMTIDKFGSGYKFVGPSYQLEPTDDKDKVIYVSDPKLKPVSIKGGVILVDTPFSIS